MEKKIVITIMSEDLIERMKSFEEPDARIVYVVDESLIRAGKYETVIADINKLRKIK